MYRRYTLRGRWPGTHEEEEEEEDSNVGRGALANDMEVLVRRDLDQILVFDQDEMYTPEDIERNNQAFFEYGACAVGRTLPA